MFCAAERDSDLQPAPEKVNLNRLKYRNEEKTFRFFGTEGSFCGAPGGARF